MRRPVLPRKQKITEKFVYEDSIDARKYLKKHRKTKTARKIAQEKFSSLPIAYEVMSTGRAQIMCVEVLFATDVKYLLINEEWNIKRRKQIKSLGENISCPHP